MARWTLEERLKELERKKLCLQQQEYVLQHRAEKARKSRVFMVGLLIEKAGLLTLPPNILLGGLMELADQASDPEIRRRWEERGAPTLAREMTTEPT